MFYVLFYVIYVNSSIAIILMGKRELVALLDLSSGCFVMVERLFLAVPRGCLRFVIVVFPDHTHLLFSLTSPHTHTTTTIHTRTHHHTYARMYIFLYASSINCVITGARELNGNNQFWLYPRIQSVKCESPRRAIVKVLRER